MEITQEEFKQLAQYIHKNFGIYLKDEKKTLLTGRLSTVLEQKGYKNFSEFYSHVVSDATGKTANLLISRISTNYSFFMRESQHFYYLRDHVLPHFEKELANRDLYVWCAACATGEEAYTLAFILEDYFRDKPGWDKKVLATDISDKALETAQSGTYEKSKVDPVPGIWRLNYFDRTDDGSYAVKSKIKKEVLFRKFNLVSNSFAYRNKFHVIFLRNVMIYFDRPTKIKLLGNMYDAMAPGGYLFIGHTEAIGPDESRFKYVMPAVYRKV